MKESCSYICMDLKSTYYKDKDNEMNRDLMGQSDEENVTNRTFLVVSLISPQIDWGQ